MHEERYWYPDDGGQVWIAGYTPVDAEGRYLARDAPELAARGLRVVSVAGAARHHAEALEAADAAPGRPLELRRDPANEHDPHAIMVLAGGELIGFVPREVAAELARRARRRASVVGRRSARAAPLAARSPVRADDLACARHLCIFRYMATDDLIAPDETAFRLELTPAQLKITHSALKSMLADFGHDEPDVHRIIREVLAKLPDEASIRAISI